MTKHMKSSLGSRIFEGSIQKNNKPMRGLFTPSFLHEIHGTQIQRSYCINVLRKYEVDFPPRSVAPSTKTSRPSALAIATTAICGTCIKVGAIGSLSWDGWMMDGWTRRKSQDWIRSIEEIAFDLEIENRNRASHVDLSLCLRDDCGKKVHFWRCSGAVVLLESLTGQSQKIQTQGDLNTWPKKCHVVNVRIALQHSNRLKTHKCP